MIPQPGSKEHADHADRVLVAQRGGRIGIDVDAARSFVLTATGTAEAFVPVGRTGVGHRIMGRCGSVTSVSRCG
jgi:hypothetical protein